MQSTSIVEASEPTTSPHRSEEETRHIRQATTQDIHQIWAIDSSATKKFGSIRELEDLAKNEESLEKFQHWLRIGRVYFVQEYGKPLGLIAAHPADGVLYIAEIAVLLESQGKGIGALLLRAAFDWAREISKQDGTETARVSLTAYAEVPWNGPWYQRHGFKEVDAATIGPWHVDKMKYDKEERDLVRPGYRRCCMLWEAKMN